MDSVTADRFLHTDHNASPLTGPRLAVLSRTWCRVEAWEAAHRPKDGPRFGWAWSVGRAQSAAVAVRLARTVVAVATRAERRRPGPPAGAAGGPLQLDRYGRNLAGKLAMMPSLSMSAISSTCSWTLS